MKYNKAKVVTEKVAETIDVMSRAVGDDYHGCCYNGCRAVVLVGGCCNLEQG